MIEQIIDAARTSTYDFREIAAKEDPLHHLFSEWVPYYRLKSAIAQILQPQSILEIGVRYGYSAHAFLHGCPEANYIGIDNDSETFGGINGALDYAQTTLPKENCRLLKLDSQKLSVLPGEIHDLIHVDGCQDGKGTYHDLELALAKGCWVLLDGYFWTEKNFMEANSFLLRHQDVIEYALIIPGYAGEMLIKTKQRHLQNCKSLKNQTTNNNTSQPLEPCYDQEYYLGDCGGYESFRQNGSEVIEDNRVLAILALATMKKRGNLLDLGCGRGEVAFQAARHGFTAIGIDYSSTSIKIAEKQREKASDISERLIYRIEDVTKFSVREKQDVVVAADLIEHISTEEVESCYARVAKHLHPKGIFVIHTFPNAWYYKYDYARRRNEAEKIGAFLTSEPRSRFERLMHINEQNPRFMRRQLLRHFHHVALWFGSPRDPVGSLEGRNSPRRLAAYRDIFALASHSPLPGIDEVSKCLTTFPLESEAISGKVSVNLLGAPDKVHSKQNFNLIIEINNNSSNVLKSLPPHPIHISYHWIDFETGKTIVREGLRTPLPRPLPPNHSGQFTLNCTSPSMYGTYNLNITLVQENVAWWNQENYRIGCNTTVNVQTTFVKKSARPRTMANESKTS